MRIDGCACYMTKKELAEIILSMPDDTEFEVGEESSFTSPKFYLVASSNYYKETLGIKELSL